MDRQAKKETKKAQYVTKNKKIRRNNKKKINKFKIWVVFFACLGLFTLVFMSNSRYFDVKNVKIIGNEYTSLETVVANIDIEGENIIFFDETKIERKLIKESWVKDVKVSTIYPDKIEIYVEERVPGALYATESDDYLVLSHELKVLEKTTKPQKELPYIKVEDSKSQEELEVGDRFLESSWEKEDKVKIFSEMNAAVMPFVGEILITGEDEIIIYTNEDLSVKLGEPRELGLKYHLMEEIFSKIQELDIETDKYQHLDLRVPDYPVLQEKTSRYEEK